MCRGLAVHRKPTLLNTSKYNEIKARSSQATVDRGKKMDTNEK